MFVFPLFVVVAAPLTKALVSNMPDPSWLVVVPSESMQDCVALFVVVDVVVVVVLTPDVVQLALVASVVVEHKQLVGLNPEL